MYSTLLFNMLSRCISIFQYTQYHFENLTNNVKCRLAIKRPKYTMCIIILYSNNPWSLCNITFTIKLFPFIKVDNE